MCMLTDVEKKIYCDKSSITKDFPVSKTVTYCNQLMDCKDITD